jgi:hypothetical protein
LLLPLCSQYIGNIPDFSNKSVLAEICSRTGYNNHGSFKTYFVTVI